MIPVPLVYVDIKSKMPCPRVPPVSCIWWSGQTAGLLCVPPPARAHCSVFVPRFVLCFVRMVTAALLLIIGDHVPTARVPTSPVFSALYHHRALTHNLLFSPHHLHSVPHENISAICIMKWLLMLTNCIAKLNCSVTVNYSVTLHIFDSM